MLSSAKLRLRQLVVIIVWVLIFYVVSKSMHTSIPVMIHNALVDTGKAILEVITGHSNLRNPVKGG